MRIILSYRPLSWYVHKILFENKFPTWHTSYSLTLIQHEINLSNLYSQFVFFVPLCKKSIFLLNHHQLYLLALIMMPYGTRLNSVMVKSSHYPGSNSPIKKLCCFMYVCMHNSNQSHDQKLRKWGIFFN